MDYGNIPPVSDLEFSDYPRRILGLHLTQALEFGVVSKADISLSFGKSLKNFKWLLSDARSVISQKRQARTSWPKTLPSDSLMEAGDGYVIATWREGAAWPGKCFQTAVRLPSGTAALLRRRAFDSVKFRKNSASEFTVSNIARETGVSPGFTCGL